MGVFGTLRLLVTSLVGWQGAAVCLDRPAAGLNMELVGPMQVAAEANLSFLVPSAPSVIVPELSLQRRSATSRRHRLLGHPPQADHPSWLLSAITALGGG